MKHQNKFILAKTRGIRAGTKSIFSIVLAFCLMLTMAPMLTLEAAAANNPYPAWQTFSYDGKSYKTIPCTTYVWQQVHNRLAIDLPALGNANSWLANASKYGYQTGTEPRVNSIACWNSGLWGHVALVTAVSGNGSFTYDEGGSVDRRRQDTVNGIYTNHPYPDGYTAKPSGFIYLDSSASQSSGSAHPDSLYFGTDFYAYILCKLGEGSGTLLLSNTNTADSQTVATVRWDGSISPRTVWHFSWDNKTASYQILSAYDGKALDVRNADDHAGNPIWTYPINNSPAQRWRLIRTSGNYFTMLPDCTAQGLVLDVTNGSTEPNAPLQLWNPNSTPAQSFGISKLTFSYVKPSKPGVPTGIQALTDNTLTTISWKAVPASSYFDKRTYEVIVDGVSYTTAKTDIALRLSEGLHSVKIRAVNTLYPDWASGYNLKMFTVVHQPFDFSKEVITGCISEPF